MVLADQAAAEVDAAGFRRMVDEHNWSARTYLMGVLTGLDTANAIARRQLGKALYCAPEGKLISPESQLEILSVYLSHVPDDEHLPLSRAVANSLAHRYPCMPL